MDKKKAPLCSKCPKVICLSSIKADEKIILENAPDFCPMTNMTDTLEIALSEYDRPDIMEFAHQASIQEFECYERTPEGTRANNPRIVETIEFAKKCGYQKIGLAFCGGLSGEAKILTDVLEGHGFEVVSVCCKAGGIPKERIGIKPEQKIRGADRFEPMCNPIFQAEALNEEKVDFAIMLGLCVGHDTLFIKHCRVPMTVIAVKDRVTGHNPLAALYTINSYYSPLKARKKEK